MAPLKMAETFSAQIGRGKQKTIVTVTSKMGSIADNSGGGSYLYRSSKAAANMVVKSLAIDLKPFGITAVVLHPGWVKTDMGGPNAMISPEQSVSGMRKVISGLGPADSGKFFAYDGQVIPW
jgi:NAD(P)-dependent dehydrogenase (short-subunit alcohol dehydrogenase family)